MPSHESYETLLRVASKDLNVAKYLTTAEDIYIEGVCIHCQQCAEKALKSFIRFNNIKYSLIHNLEKLLIDCINLDKTFTTIETHCVILNHYSSDTRYTDNSSIPEREMHEAIELAEEVLNFVKEKFEKSNLS